MRRSWRIFRAGGARRRFRSRRDVIAYEEIQGHCRCFLALTLASPEWHRQHPVLGRLNNETGFGDAALGVQATDARFDDLVAAVERFRPRY